MTDHVPTANTDSITIRSGSPVWIDLSVPDLAVVRRFYESLFGWDFEDYGEEFGHYHMITNGGAHVGGAMSQTEGEGEQTTAWTVYLKSDDVEKTLADTAAAGGAVLTPAMPVGELGVMGIATTPGGEVVGLWQNGTFGGFIMTRTPGSPAWFEVMSFDFDADAEYYRTVWGWELAPLAMDGSEGEATGEEGQGTDVAAGGQASATRYANNHPGDTGTAGLCEAEPSWYPEGTPSYWRVYFIVEDSDAAVQTVTQSGGSVLDGPMDTPFGWIATVADPAGATFQIVQLPEDERAAQ